MMTAIPPFSWNEVATKADLAQFATRDEMRTEFAAVRHEMKLEFAAVRLEFAAVRLEMERSDSQMRGYIAKNFQNLLFQIATINISTAGIVIAALHILR